MQGKAVKLVSDDGRWLEMTVRDDRASARVGESEPFPFSFENLGYVARGMGYQAWGAGSHFTFRHEPNGVVVEFQGPGDRGAALVRLSQDRLRAAIDDLDALAPAAVRASVI